AQSALPLTDRASASISAISRHADFIRSGGRQVRQPGGSMPDRQPASVARPNHATEEEVIRRRRNVMNSLTPSVTVDRRAHLLRLGAFIAAALLLSLVFFSTSPRAAESNPTIVLVHGAFASPAGWAEVANALHKDGYQTATPALGLDSVGGDV